jgi:hypothetical protein
MDDALHVRSVEAEAADSASWLRDEEAAAIEPTAELCLI